MSYLRQHSGCADHGSAHHAGLNVIIILVVALFYKELQAISFDETFAFVVNVPANRLTCCWSV